MKLYFAPAACSLSPHIALREAGLPFELVKTDLRTKVTSDGSDLFQVSPLGYVPALLLDNGEVLTEGPVIVQYIADLVPHLGLAPPPGSMARYRLQQWLNFISTELHKGFSPLFSAEAPDAFKAVCRQRLGERLGWLARELQGRPYLLGDQFTVADGYLFTVLGWCRLVGIGMATWPPLVAYTDRMGERPAVQAALVAERALRTRV